MRSTFLTTVLFLLMFPGLAQIKSTTTTSGVKYTNRVTPEDIKRIDQLVAPLRAKLNSIYNDGSGTYESFVKEVKAMANLKAYKDREAASLSVIKRYGPFFEAAWKKAGIDESSYQKKIRSLLSQIDPTKLIFTNFLSFKVVSTQPSTTSTSPPPAYVNICNIALPSTSGNGTAISGADTRSSHCELVSDAWAGVAGLSNSSGTLDANVRVPGTFNMDNRKLHYRLRYDYDLSVTAFAVLGVSFVSASADGMDESDEHYAFVAAPFIWADAQHLTGSVSADLILSKTTPGVKVQTFTTLLSDLISGSWAHAEMTNLNWTVCEE